jgi:hypothetical protein
VGVGWVEVEEEEEGHGKGEKHGDWEDTGGVCCLLESVAKV